jgi:hypothetical protein
VPPLWVCHLEHPKPLVAEAVDNMQADYSFGILGYQPGCISTDLFRIRLLKCKILDGCFHFGQLGIGIILEFYHPAPSGELFMKFTDKLKIASALGGRSFPP